MVVFRRMLSNLRQRWTEVVQDAAWLFDDTVAPLTPKPFSFGSKQGTAA